MTRFQNILIAAGLCLAAIPANALFMHVPADRVDEVPIERIIQNLERNAQKLPPEQKWRAIGRLRLLAYLRQSSALPEYRERPGSVAEGRIGECIELDQGSPGGPPVAPTPPGTEVLPAKPGEKCEARSYELGPRKELPSGAFDVKNAPNKDLRLSRDAYERARRLDPSNLRTRLALAFIYGRFGEHLREVNELRRIAKTGLIKLPQRGEQSDWELHVVLSEVVEHFSRVAKLRSDRRLVAVLKGRLEASPPVMYVTPIIVPLNDHASFKDLIDLHSTVSFDFLGQGLPMQGGWVKRDAAWLVWDPQQRRKINSGFQMFGSVTFVASWEHGYAALGALDDNGDQELSGDELNGLSLWVDQNADGVSDASEVKPVTEHSIVALKFDHVRTDTDHWTSPAGVRFQDGTVRPTYDWVLAPATTIAQGGAARPKQ